MILVTPGMSDPTPNTNIMESTASNPPPNPDPSTNKVSDERGQTSGPWAALKRVLAQPLPLRTQFYPETPNVPDEVQRLTESFARIHAGSNVMWREYDLKREAQQFEVELDEFRRLYEMWRKQPTLFSELFPTVVGFWGWMGFGEKKGWDILQLLIAPLLLAAFGLVLQEYVKWHDEQLAEHKKEQDHQLAENKERQDRQLADDKAKQDTLVKYFDQMADSLKDGLLKAEQGSEKFTIAQSRTVVTLQSLDSKRQHLVIQFLQSSRLNQATDKAGLNEILLREAQMSKANLVNSDLSGASLMKANLNAANLGCAPPENKVAPSQCSNLSYAFLPGANLSDANLSGANLRGANLNKTNLSGANLRGANLSYSKNISKATLSETDLSKADLRGTKHMTAAQLKDAKLCQTKLPEGLLLDPDRDCKK